jgi:hypothetical protein
MAKTTIHSLAYIVTANTEQFEKGMMATRQELRASKQLMEDSVPAIEKYQRAMANADNLLAKGLIDKRAHADAVARVKQDYSQMGRDATLLATGQEKFASSMRKMAAGAAGIFTVSKAIGMVREQFDNIDATVKDAEKLGIAIDDLMRLRGVADMAGDASAESVDKAIAKLNMNLKHLREGADSAVAMFEQIGLTAADLQGLDLGDAFLKVADGIAMIEGADKQLAATQEILGKGAGDLANMLKMGSDEIERMGKGIPAVNALDAEKIAKAKDSMERIGRAIDALSQTMAVSLAPAIEQIANAAARMFGQQIDTPEPLNLPSDPASIAKRQAESMAQIEQRGFVEFSDNRGKFTREMRGNLDAEKLTNFFMQAQTLDPNFSEFSLTPQQRIALERSALKGNRGGNQEQVQLAILETLRRQVAASEAMLQAQQERPQDATIQGLIQ